MPTPKKKPVALKDSVNPFAHIEAMQPDKKKKAEAKKAPPAPKPKKWATGWNAYNPVAQISDYLRGVEDEQ